MNSKIYKIGFFALLVINVAMVMIFILRPKPSRSHHRIKNQIGLKLGFTEEQKVQFGEMAKDHREAIRSLEKKEKELVKLYFGTLSSEDSIENNEVLLQEIAQLEKTKFQVTYAHFEGIKGLCSEDQLANFDEVIIHVIPKLASRSPRRSGKEGQPK